MKKRHHKIPRFYLSRFAVPKDGEADKEELWVYDKLDGSVRPSTPTKAGRKRHAYTVTLEDGTRSDALEDMFERDFETPASRLYDKLIADGTLEGENRVTFACFLGLMRVRTDSFRQQFAQWAMAYRQTEESIVASDDRFFRARIRKIEAGFRPLTSKEKDAIREVWSKPQSYELSVDKGWTLRALAAIEKIVPLLHDMQWSVMHATGDAYFVTGDDPVVLELQPGSTGPRGPYLAHPDVQVTMPLTPKTCLLATWDESAPMHFDIPSEGVEHVNKRRAIHATRQLYGPCRDERIEQLAAQYRDAEFRVSTPRLSTEGFSRVVLRRSDNEPA